MLANDLMQVSFAKTSDWGSGYDGCISITNTTATDVLNWSMKCEFPGTFTWISDVVVSKKGQKVDMTPKDWTKKISAGATLAINFGGSSGTPSNFSFSQVLPVPPKDTEKADKSRGHFGVKVFAPYVDVCAYPTPSLQSYTKGCGLKMFTLAFITASNGKPSWGGVIPLEQQFYMDQIQALRLSGGDVIVSFGGAAGVELALVITDVHALAAAYQSVIDMYRLKFVDFDVEGAAVADAVSVDRRNKAIAILQRDNPGLTVSYCLPVLPSGLTRDGVAVLSNAKANGVRVDVVAVMAMDYGDSAAPNPQGRMGKYAIQAAQSTHDQACTQVGLQCKIGIIPMIGINDVVTEIFTIKDAKEVAKFAASADWVRYTSFWSMNRDANCAFAKAMIKFVK